MDRLVGRTRRTGSVSESIEQVIVDCTPSPDDGHNPPCGRGSRQCGSTRCRSQHRRQGGGRPAAGRPARAPLVPLQRALAPLVALHHLLPPAAARRRRSLPRGHQTHRRRLARPFPHGRRRSAAPVDLGARLARRGRRKLPRRRRRPPRPLSADPPARCADHFRNCCALGLSVPPPEAGPAGGDQIQPHLLPTLRGRCLLDRVLGAGHGGHRDVVLGPRVGAQRQGGLPREWAGYGGRVVVGAFDALLADRALLLHPPPHPPLAHQDRARPGPLPLPARALAPPQGVQPHRDVGPADAPRRVGAVLFRGAGARAVRGAPDARVPVLPGGRGRRRAAGARRVRARGGQGQLPALAAPRQIRDQLRGEPRSPGLAVRDVRRRHGQDARPAGWQAGVDD